MQTARTTYNDSDAGLMFELYPEATRIGDIQRRIVRERLEAERKAREQEREDHRQQMEMRGRREEAEMVARAEMEAVKERLNNLNKEA